MIFKQVLVSTPPSHNNWVPIVDANDNLFIARWVGNGWNYRDVSGPNTPDNNAPIVGWIQPARLFLVNELDNCPAEELQAIEPERYFMDRDQDGHWFLVPEKFRIEWMEWLNIPEEDERSWVPYLHAIPINGDPTAATFCFPNIIRKPEIAKEAHHAYDLPFLHKRNHDFLKSQPKASDFGYEEPNPNLAEEGGWTLEGGQEAYSSAIEKWTEENRCPECMILCGKQELLVFDGFCEDCASPINEDEA